MRKVIILMATLCAVLLPALAQITPATNSFSAPDNALLAKTRALYDAPFTRGLISFDCAVQFDWKKHFLESIGNIPPTALPTVERLQRVQHRVFMDRSGAVVTIPKPADMTGSAHGADLEKAFDGVLSGGLNAWLPFAANVILPVGATKFNFEKTNSGYSLTLNGTNMAAQLQLSADLRLISGISQLPVQMRFTTVFSKGPDGFLLSSNRTENTTSPTDTSDTSFQYTYQAVQGFQLPLTVAVKPSTSEPWNYTLTGCKVEKGIAIKLKN